MTSYLFNAEASTLNIDLYMYGTMTSVRDFEEHIRDIFAHLFEECDVIKRFEGRVGLFIYFPLSWDRGAIEQLLSSKMKCKLGWEFVHLYEKHVNNTHQQSIIWNGRTYDISKYDARVAARKHHDTVFVPARPSEGEVQAGSLQTQLLSYYLL